MHALTRTNDAYVVSETVLMSAVLCVLPRRRDCGGDCDRRRLDGGPGQAHRQVRNDALQLR